MDRTRDADLKQLYQEREGKSVVEREKIDKLMHDIRSQDNPEINRAREDIVRTVRAGQGKATRAATERLKILTHKKGVEHRG